MYLLKTFVFWVLNAYKYSEVLLFHENVLDKTLLFQKKRNFFYQGYRKHTILTMFELNAEI